MPVSPKLAQRFVHFADHECADEPLYDAACRIVAAQPALLDLLRDASDEQQRPNLWLAAVHDLLLAGSQHPLRAYYASCGGTCRPDAELAGALADFVARHEPALRERMATRSTQTNEIGRCAVLWPALHAIAHRAGGRPLALLDLGCSAGLNLGVDAYRFDYEESTAGAPAGEGTPTLPCRFVGPHRPAFGALQIARREGIDPAPVDVHDAEAVRWLRACLWPSNTGRAQRFDQAVARARRHAWPVRHVADCTAEVSRWLDGLPPDVQPVVFHSWVLTYFEPAARQAHVDTMTALVRDRGAAWLAAEDPSLAIVANPPPATPETARGSLWTLAMRDGGEARFEVLARSHPHGRWMEWLAG
jgi:hypothetical protein